MGQRTDDIEAFKRGDEEELFRLKSTKDIADLLKAIASAKVARLTGTQPNLGNFQISNLDEARDQWSHRFSRREQQALLQKAFAARFVNRNAASGRGLVFLSGDIHIGCIFDVSAARPRGTAVSLTSSGISQIDSAQPLVGTFVDEEFSLAPGIRSTLRDVVNVFNFGVVQVQPTGSGAEISAVLAHEGNASALGLDVKDLIKGECRPPPPPRGPLHSCAAARKVLRPAGRGRGEERARQHRSRGELVARLGPPYPAVGASPPAAGLRPGLERRSPSRRDSPARTG
jgi:hypothetical protein